MKKIIPYIVFFIILVAFSPRSDSSALIIKNKTDYDLRVVFMANKVDSIERLAQILFTNYKHFYNHSDSIYLKNSSFEKWHEECQNPIVYNKMLDHLIDSCNIFSFGINLIPYEHIVYSRSNPITLVQDGEDIFPMIDSLFYKNKDRNYYHDMVANNWFEIPLPKNSKLTFTSGAYPGSYHMSLFADTSKSIKVMLDSTVIKEITKDNFEQLDKREGIFGGYKYYRLKIRKKYIEVKSKLSTK